MPKIIVDGELIADTPDETGDYLTLDGRPIGINTDHIGREKTVQLLGVQCELLRGRPGSSTERGIILVTLSPGKGSGSKTLTREIKLVAQLNYVPIRDRSLSQSITHPWFVRDSHPRWRRGRER